MDEMQMLGYIVTAVITLGAFYGVIQKFTQPINELRVVIQKLLDNMESMEKSDQDRDEKIEKQGDELREHGKEIGDLKSRVGKMETRMDIYHKGGH